MSAAHLLTIIVWLLAFAFVVVAVVIVLQDRRKRPKTLPAIRVGAYKVVKIQCAVCGEPLEYGDIVAYRYGETPWHVRHKEKR